MKIAGEYIPPMLIFKRKRMADHLKKGGPPIQFILVLIFDELYVNCFVTGCYIVFKCLRLLKSNKNQVLIILDGHATHTKNIEAIRLARENGIIMLS